MPEEQSSTPDMMALLVEAFQQEEIPVERLSQTELRIHLSDGRTFTNDFASSVEDARSYPDESYPEMARHVVLALMRALRERGAPLGNRYPPRSGDHGRGALVAVLEQMGLDARFEDPQTLSVPMGDGRRASSDVGTYLSRVENASIDEAFEAAGPFAQAIAQQIEQVRAKEEPSEVRLRVRLYPDTALPEEVWERLLYREPAPGLRQTVAADTPDSLRPLDRAELAGLGLSEEEAFEAAVSGSLEEPAEVSEHELDGVRIIHIGGQHPYAAARVHALAEHVGEAPHGALVALPVPQAVLVHPLGQGHPIAAMERLQELAERFAADADKPITTQLYWWHPSSRERSGAELPDLRPVRAEVDHEARSVSLHSSDDEFGPVLDMLMRRN
ncbi:hypothetical protein [Nocardiopsis algeriensis]|uniref:Uncharacterized protein n=1 Tax=Nocardiopsis algeriensis TaxID=1478215 RepID=A0A841IQ56_9ACTN|nr:hypothetical protein [Nocardiopsis algeriensis]MBB6120837.1 hypothetical protein [Nocardiopsis algeriensis]